MLVLSRQRDQTIMIGDEIEITVVDIRGDKVRLGITAPTRIAVHRKEVYEAIKRENEQAAQFNSRIDGGDLDVIRRTIRQFQVKKEKIEMLLFQRGERLFDRADNDPAEADLLKENLKEALQALVVIDH